jgi:fido (protein-threonine AMPylation protein)
VPFRKSKPGETPLDDISGLKIKGLQTQAERNEVEAQNILKASLKYLSGKPSRTVAPFDLSWVYKLHNEMFGDVWTWAGKRRQTNLNMGVSCDQIETSLQQMLDNLDYQEQSGLDLIEQTVILHHHAVRIHPFQDGNGRWARMLVNIWLKLHERNIIDWPAEIRGSSESVIRQEYLAAIRSAINGDDDPLTELHRRFSQSDYPWTEVRNRRQPSRPLRRRKRRRPPLP